MAKYSTLSGLFKAIADAIRSMGAASEKINAQDMPDLIKQISTGSDVSGVTASAGDVRSGKKFVTSGGSLIDGTLGNATLTVNKPTVNSSGLVTASATLTKAGVLENAPENNTLQLSTQGAKTVTPSESGQTAVEAGKYTTGAVGVGAISKTYVGSGVTRQEAKTVTPSESSQTAVASGRYTTGAVTVAAIPSSYKRVYRETRNISGLGSATFTVAGVGSKALNYITCAPGFVPKTISITYGTDTDLHRVSYDANRGSYIVIQRGTQYAYAVSVTSPIQLTASYTVIPVTQGEGSGTMSITITG